MLRGLSLGLRLRAWSHLVREWSTRYKVKPGLINFCWADGSFVASKWCWALDIFTILLLLRCQQISCLLAKGKSKSFFTGTCVIVTVICKNRPEIGCWKALNFLGVEFCRIFCNNLMLLLFGESDALRYCSSLTYDSNLILLQIYHCFFDINKSCIFHSILSR